MKSYDGYLKRKLGENYVHLTNGGHKPLSDFLMGNTAANTYVKKNGDTMTGVLTLLGNQYNGYDDGTYGMNANNSDIVGVNSILTSDLSNSWRESIGFKRTNGNWDTFRAVDGTFYFGVNNGTEYTAVHSGNISSLSVSYADSSGLLKPNVTTSGTSYKTSVWTNSSSFSNYTIVWGESISNSSVSSSDTGDILLALRSGVYNGGGAQELCLAIDGDYYAAGGAHKVWHAGNLTNNNQLTNGAGYITSSALADYIPKANFVTSNASDKANWGTLSGSAYTKLLLLRSPYGTNDLGCIYFAYYSNSSSDTRISVQVDGYFYLNEGTYRVVDTSDLSYYLPKTGGTIKNGSTSNPLNIDTESTNAWTYYYTKGSVKASVGYWNNLAFVCNEIPSVGTCRIGVTDAGNPEFWVNSTVNKYAIHTSRDGATFGGSIRIHSDGGSWNEGIRMHPSSNSWCGVVMCGTDNTGASGTSAKTWSMHNNDGTFYIAMNGSSSGTNGVTGTSSSWTFWKSVYTNSDRRLKKNISIISDKELDNLFNVSSSLLKEFTWKSNNIKSYGFIALELEEVIPEAVQEDVNGIKSVSHNVAYAKIIASLIYKIKLMDTELKELKSEFNKITERRLT